MPAPKRKVREISRKGSGMCDCNVKLPHVLEKVVGTNRLMKSYFLPPEPDILQAGIIGMDAQTSSGIFAAMETASNDTAVLREKIGYLEGLVDKAEKTVVHDHLKNCVYGNKLSGLEPRVPEPANRDKIQIKILEEKLLKANTQLVQQRNLIKTLKDTQELCKHVIQKEMGFEKEIDNFDQLIQTNNFMGWKSRNVMIHSLRSRIVDLESKLRRSNAGAPRVTDADTDDFDPKKFSMDARREPKTMVSKKQRQTLDRMYQDKTEQMHRAYRALEQGQANYNDMEAKYRGTMARNQILTEELKDHKQKVTSLMEKTKVDGQLIASLVSYQTMMSVRKNEEQSMRDLEEQRQQDLEDICGTRILSMPPQQVDEEAEETVFKNIEDANEVLESMVLRLEHRLKIVTIQVIEAETHCCNHQEKLEELRELFDEMKRLGKVSGRSRTAEEKSLRFKIADEQVRSLTEENYMLKKFVKDAILTKASDFQLYKNSVETAKRNYLISLQKLKTAAKAPPPEEEEQEEDEA